MFGGATIRGGSSVVRRDNRATVKIMIPLAQKIFSKLYTSLQLGAVKDSRDFPRVQRIREVAEKGNGLDAI